MSRESIIKLVDQLVTELRAGTSCIPCDIMRNKCVGCPFKHGGQTCAFLMLAGIGEIVLEDNKYAEAPK